MSLPVSVVQTSARRYGVKVYGLRYPLKIEDARALARALNRAAAAAEARMFASDADQMTLEDA
jgi:hypothetical protein